MSPTLDEACAAAVLLPEDPPLITVAGDWHGNGLWAQSVIHGAAAAGAAGVLHLGDLGIWPGSTGRRYLDRVQQACSTAGIPLWFIDGNHEDFWQLSEYPVDPRTGLRPVRPGVFHLPRGTRWRWYGLRWLALGGATSLDRVHRQVGVSWWPEEALTLGDAARAADGGVTDIMLTHDCPAGVTVPGLPTGRWTGDAMHVANAHRRLLRDVVDAVTPTHLFHGHFHVDYQRDLDLGGGLSTAVRGLSMDGGPGNTVLLDLAALAEASAERRLVQEAATAGSTSPATGSSGPVR